MDSEEARKAALPSFLRDEVKDAVIEFQLKTEVNKMTDRELSIFSFGFEYGQRHILKMEAARKIRQGRQGG